MYRIMLADDEGIVTDSLKFIIDKEFAGLCETETAKTGRAVIETAETFKRKKFSAWTVLPPTPWTTKFISRKCPCPFCPTSSSSTRTNG